MVALDAVVPIRKAWGRTEILKMIIHKFIKI